MKVNNRVLYRDELELSSEQWLEILQDKSVFKEEDILLMLELYASKDCREKASVLAERLGVSSHSVLNVQIGRLGKRIVNRFTGVKFPTREDGTIRYWHIPFWAENAEIRGQFYWELRPELMEAIEAIKRSGRQR